MSPSADAAVPVSVELGLYSGRPDPGWSLSAEDAATLEALLATLSEGVGTPPVGGLGYHGFTITLPGMTLVAYRGAVAPRGDGQRPIRLDPTRSVERYLLETARQHITPEEFAQAEAAIAAP